MATDHFPTKVVASIQKERMLGIRAGTDHDFTGIWAVVVENRVFVRSWDLSPRSWYRTFLENPEGEIQTAGRTVKVRAKPTRSDRIKDLVSRAYKEKYNTPGSVQYVRGLARPKRRETTTELVPR